MRTMSKLRFAALVPALALASSGVAGNVRIARDPAAQPIAPVVAGACPLACGEIYAHDLTNDDFGSSSVNFWIIKPDAGTAIWVGNSPFPILNDIALTPAGEMYAVVFDSESVFRLDSCTFQQSGPTIAGSGGNSLAGDLTNLDLYGGSVQLVVIDSTDGATAFPPSSGWCGFLSGDLVMNQADGLLYGTMNSCPDCAGDVLVKIDPATGNLLGVVGCILDAAGTAYPSLYGLAFDNQCRLFASPAFGSFVLEVSTTDASATFIPITGFAPITNTFFNGAWGMASYPCAPCVTDPPDPPTCEPLTQGFWKRQCQGPHPSGEHDNLPTYPPCISQHATFAGTATEDDICDEIVPQPRNSKCEQARAQFMALLLNVCSGRLDEECCIDTPTTSATTVGEAIDEIDTLLSGSPGFADCVRAQAIADAINTGAALCGGSAQAAAQSAPTVQQHRQGPRSH